MKAFVLEGVLLNFFNDFIYLSNRETEKARARGEGQRKKKQTSAEQGAPSGTQSQGRQKEKLAPY